MKDNHRGYVVGNSVIASEICTDGELFSNIRYNPPCFIDGLNEIISVGSMHLNLVENGKNISMSDLKIDYRENIYPYFVGDFTTPSGLRIGLEAFAPIDPKDEKRMFLPFVVLSFNFECENEREITLGLEFLPDNKVKTDGDMFVRVGDICGIGSASKNRKIKSGDKILALFGIFSVDSFWRNEFDSYEALSDFVMDSYDSLHNGILDFIAAIPHIAGDNDRDGKIFEYTRWYTQAAVMLTKADCHGTVITMGYNELNQRDSFWTTFMHTLIFPQLDRKMIEISAEYQRADGKIPTTILPLIERDTDLDINEYFCMRIARYYRNHPEKEFLRQIFGSYKRSVDYLISRDLDGDGLPEQTPPSDPECFWGDWKDVPYVSGRKLAPHFSLLWLAVLKEGAFLADEIDDTETAEFYRKLYAKAYEKVNAPYDGTENGGMFDVNHYAEVWYDGKKRDNVLEDQTVGILFDVVPADKRDLIYEALKVNTTTFGIRETFPYRTDSHRDRFLKNDEGDLPGTYHNGGIWPWVNFCDYAGRYKNGRKDEVIELVRRLGYYDLERPGDYRPNEYISGENGENCGCEVQGWSSAVWAIEYVKRQMNTEK